MLFTFHSVNLVIFVVAVVVSGITVSKLRTASDTYNARLLAFGYFSLSSWILWAVQYAIIAAPFLSFPTGSSLDAVLSLTLVQNALWATAVLSLHFRQFLRKSLTLPLLVIFTVAAVITYKTSILSSPRYSDYVTVPDAVSALTIFIVLTLSIWQLRLSKLSAAAFLIHGYSQWIWRSLWLTPSGTTWAVQLIFPLWRIALLIAWFRLISEMRQRVQPAVQKFAQLSDQNPSNVLERPDISNFVVPLKVMISSTVEDLRAEREVVDRAIHELQLTRFRAETFGSVPHPPKVVCELLAEQCDIFVLIIGKRYGYVMSDGMSVVEFEYRIARAQNPQKILVYVKDGVKRKPPLTEFLKCVQDFEHGYFRSSFSTPDDLHDKIQGDITRWLASQVIHNRQAIQNR